MVRYFVYYNVGGFKDLYLGDSSLQMKSCFYLPLLGVYKARLAEEQKKGSSDEKLIERISSLSALPQIEEIRYGSPNCFCTEVGNAITHGGYHMMHRELDNGESMIIVRDIDGCSDEYNRSSPFHFIVVATPESNANMHNLSTYIRLNASTFKQKIASFFTMDIEANGLRCDFDEMNNYVTDLLNAEAPLTEPQTETTGQEPMSMYPQQRSIVHTLIVESSHMLTTVLAELHLSSADVQHIFLTNGKPIISQSRYTSKPESGQKQKNNPSRIDICEQIRLLLREALKLND